MPAKKTSTESKAPASTRNILITSAEGHTGRLVIELLMTDGKYANKFATITALVFSEGDKELEELGVTVLPYKPGQDLQEKLKDTDTCLLIPPARKDKAKLTKELLEQAKKAKSVTNVVFLSSAACDFAERDKQPRLREFVDLETLAMESKQDPETGDTGHSPCIIRPSFYAENLLLYNKQAQGEGKLPLPIDPNHKFSPVALGDIAQVAAYVLTSEGPHGLADNVRGQVIILTGPAMVAGPELAEAASQALGTKMEFESITEEKAKEILSSDQGAEVDEAEKEYLLEYYSLVREGKTAYVADLAFQALFGTKTLQLPDFFKNYSEDFKPKKRKTNVAAKK